MGAIVFMSDETYLAYIHNPPLCACFMFRFKVKNRFCAQQFFMQFSYSEKERNVLPHSILFGVCVYIMRNSVCLILLCIRDKTRFHVKLIFNFLSNQIAAWHAVCMSNQLSVREQIQCIYYVHHRLHNNGLNSNQVKLGHIFTTYFNLVVKALGYKSEGRGFETRWREILHLPNPSGRSRPWGLLSLLQKLVPETFLGVKCGWRVGLIALLPSMSRLSRQCGILNISQPYRSRRPVTGIALLFTFFSFLYGNCK
jgi:hypothetical protein